MANRSKAPPLLTLHQVFALTPLAMTFFLPQFSEENKKKKKDVKSLIGVFYVVSVTLAKPFRPSNSIFFPPQSSLSLFPESY